MNILVINCGSSSLKYQVIDSESTKVLCKGLCERIGIDGALTYQPDGGDKIQTTPAMPTHTEAIQFVLDAITDPQNGVIKDLSEIGAVGHRIVHGGESFTQSALVTDEMLKAVEACNDFAPLHNPANIIGIEACKKLMPNTPMVGVFDTAFHQTMPGKAYMYAIPYKYYEEDKVRRYGFHGTSHSYVSKRVCEVAGVDPANTKVIVCHLGNGASICAVDGGKSVDTSMGFTPLEGLVMGTRSGDVDPGALELIANRNNMSVSDIVKVLNKESGVEGISGVSSDFRDLDNAAAEGNERAKLALDMFAYRVAKYVGAYAAAMKGVDIIAFTAGIGENSIEMREMIGEYFAFLGTSIDKSANDVRGKEQLISTADSKVKVYIIPTNEELAIARETAAIVDKN